MHGGDLSARAEAAARDLDGHIAAHIGVAACRCVCAGATDAADRAVDLTARDADGRIAVQCVKAAYRDDAVHGRIGGGGGERAAVNLDGHVADGADRLIFAGADRAAAHIPPSAAVNLDFIAEETRRLRSGARDGTVRAAPDGDRIARVGTGDTLADRKVVAAAENVHALVRAYAQLLKPHGRAEEDIRLEHKRAVVDLAAVAACERDLARPFGEGRHGGGHGGFAAEDNGAARLRKPLESAAERLHGFVRARTVCRVIAEITEENDRRIGRGGRFRALPDDAVKGIRVNVGSDPFIGDLCLVRA